MLCTLCQSKRSSWMLVFTCCLWNLRTSSAGDDGVGYSRVWCMQCWWCTPPNWSSVRGPPGFGDGALVGMCYTLSRICCWLRSMYWLLWASILFSALPYPKIIHLLQSSQCYGWEKRKWASWAASRKSGEEECSLCTHFFSWGNYWPAQTLFALEEDDCSYPCQCFYSFIYFLLHWCAGTSQLYSQAFIKVFPFISHCETQFLWGYEDGYSDFTILLKSLRDSY